MIKSNSFRGAGTALVTPFDSKNNVDVNALQRLVDFQIDQGINFLVPCGTTGESATLSFEEHMEVIETVVKQTKGRVPVIGGAGGYNTEKVIEMAKAVEKLGVDALLSVTPYYNKPTQEGLYQHFKAIANAVDTSIILYNVPSRTQCNMLPDTVVRLAAIENIIALKAASGNISQIGEMAVKKTDDFILLSGDDPNTLPIIALGGSGVISVISNQVPADIVKLTALCLDGQFDRAMEVQKRLYKLMKLNFIEVNPIPVKAGLAMMGLIDENYRLPLSVMNESNKALLANELKNLGLLS
ncbi:4-hydroxy-tetrahydrodipicolinate synthase [bacterium]|nr:4-hydroxy-tetrahydrodipicolinate synthase [bacterium]